MFGSKGQSNNMPVGGDAWAGLRSPSNTFMGQMKNGMDVLRDRQNSMSPKAQKFQQSMFQQMQPGQAEFSPVQFGGGAQPNSLMDYIMQLRQRGNQ